MSKQELAKEQIDQDELQEEEIRDDAMVGRAFWISLAVIAVVASCGIGAYLAYQYLQRETVVVKAGELKAAAKRDVAGIDIPQVTFTDITALAGIDFQHVNGANGEKLLPETMGGGVAFLDFDNDGDQDLFFVNSRYWPGEQPAESANPVMALFQNDGLGNFANVTERVGLGKTFYGMGVAVGDYDNDGWRDLYVSAVGRNHLFRNVAGKFEDVTESAGVAGGDTDWGTSCGWFDYDQDGLLDLFVCNYITWSKEEDLKLGSTLDGVNRAYAPPRTFVGAFPSLFHNEGDGKFTDVSETAGLQIRDPNQNLPEPKSLGLSFFDFDHDGWTDVFTANDTTRNMLFRNQHDGTFEEVGQAFGIAYDRSGNARGAMGIDTALFRSDDSVGIVIGNFANEPVSLYVAQAQSSLFTDEASASGLGPQSKQELTFGMFFFDYDLDGRLDVLAANGHLEEEIRSRYKNQSYEQAPRLFWNIGEGHKDEFIMVPEDSIGKDFSKPLVGRGAAYADVDSDGDLDVIITACGKSPRLLRNDQNLNHHWLRVQLVAKDKNRDAYGATVTVQTSSGKLHRTVSPTCSYLSQRELPVTFGLADGNSIKAVEIHWPDGSHQILHDVQSDQLLVVKQE